VIARRFDSTGTPSAEFVVNTVTADRQQAPRISGDGGGNFVVVWASHDQGYRDVVARRLSAAGFSGDQFFVNTHTQNNQRAPDVAMGTSGFVVVWEGYDDGYQYGVFGRRYDASGVALDGAEFQVNAYITNFQEYPAVGPRLDRQVRGDLG
jgi:hypothetical protein